MQAVFSGVPPDARVESWRRRGGNQVCHSPRVWPVGPRSFFREMLGPNSSDRFRQKKAVPLQKVPKNSPPVCVRVPGVMGRKTGKALESRIEVKYRDAGDAQSARRPDDHTLSLCGDSETHGPPDSMPDSPQTERRRTTQIAQERTLWRPFLPVAILCRLLYTPLSSTSRCLSYTAPPHAPKPQRNVQEERSKEHAA